MDERARSIVELVIAASGGAGVTGLFAWLNGRKPGEAAILAATASLQEALNAAAENQVASLQRQISEQDGRLDRLQGEIDRLEGELRDEKQKTESLERILRRNGYDLSAATEPGALTIIDPKAGTADVIAPARRRKRL